MVNDGSRFIQVACTALGIKTPQQIREEELTKIILAHIQDHEPNLIQIYNQIFEDHRPNYFTRASIEDFLDEELAF